MADNNVSADHDYVLCYQKGSFEGFIGYKKDFKGYKNPDNDPNGPWVLGDLTVGMTASMRPNQAYDLVDPATGNVYPFNPNRVWAYIPETIEELIRNGRVCFPNDTSNRPMLKRFKKDLKSEFNPFSTLMFNDVGLNTEATKIIQKIFGGNIFEYSKPPSLLITLIKQATIMNDIVIDFFAGSCVTAEAVLKVNRNDGASRKFIMVQLPELCEEKSEAYKAGYKTISDIGKERIRLVINKLEKEQTKGTTECNTDNVQKGIFDESVSVISNLERKPDWGFRVFKLDRSNFKVWEGSVDGELPIEEQIEMAIDHIDPNSSEEDILYEILLKSGFELTTPIGGMMLTGKKVYSVADGALLICLEKELTKEVIRAMAEKEPHRVVCLDSGFEGNDQLKTNAVQIMKSFNVENFRTV